MGRRKVRKTKRKLDIWEKPGAAGAFRGIGTTAKTKGVSLKRAKKFLSKKDAYSLHVTPPRRFSRRGAVAGTINSLWQMDLAMMDKYESENDGKKYLLVIIDVVSRYLYVEAMASKSAEATIEALEAVFLRASSLPKKLFSDR